MFIVRFSCLTSGESHETLSRNAAIYVISSVPVVVVVLAPPKGVEPFVQLWVHLFFDITLLLG